MPENEKKTSLTGVDTESLVDEILKRSDLSDDDAKRFKMEVMKSCGYKVTPTYVKPSRKEEKRPSRNGWLGRNSHDDDDDDDDDFEL
jgi:polyhydroxyalkanoate synthesis regulator phasin